MDNARQIHLAQEGDMLFSRRERESDNRHRYEKHSLKRTSNDSCPLDWEYPKHKRFAGNKATHDHHNNTNLEPSRNKVLTDRFCEHFDFESHPRNRREYNLASQTRMQQRTTRDYSGKPFPNDYNQISRQRDREIQSCFPDERNRPSNQRKNETFDRNRRRRGDIVKNYAVRVPEEDINAKRERIKKKKEKRDANRLKRKAQKFTYGKPSVLEIKDKETEKIAEDKVAVLIKCILDIVEENVLKNPLNVNMTYPKYLGYDYSEEKLRVICSDYCSLEFLKSSLQRKLLWEGAVLKFICASHYERFVDIKLPKSIVHLSEFRLLCEESNSTIDTKTWRVVAYQDDDDGRRCYTIGLSLESYNMLLNELNGVLRCGNEDVHVTASEINKGKKDFKEEGDEEEDNDREKSNYDKLNLKR